MRTDSGPGFNRQQGVGLSYSSGSPERGIESIAPHEVRWTRDRIRAFWEFAGSREAFQSRFFAETAANYVLLEYLRHQNPPHRILDVGTGTGAMLREARRRGINGVGVDVSKSLLRSIRKRMDGIPGLALGDAVRLPFRGQTFSGAFALELLEHLPNGREAEVLGELARVLDRSGRLVLTVPFQEDLSSEMTLCPECGAIFHRTQHMRSFRPGELEELLASAGFTTERLEVVDIYHVTARPLARFLKGLLGLTRPSHIFVIATLSSG